MVMPDTRHRYTVDEVLAFPEDGKRYEVVGGELLVTPAPAPVHQLLVSRILARLHGYLAQRPRTAEVLVAPADIQWDDERLVQPDVFVVPAGEVSNRWATYQTLLLVVEVVSPGSGRADHVVKRRAYQRQRVRTYWVVDAEAELVEVWRPEDERPQVVTDLLVWRVTEDAPEFRVEVPELFAGLPR